MTGWAERNTIQCEVVKIGMSQDKNGHILKLAIHPNDLPKDLILDHLGSRYIMVLARLNDQDEVVKPADKSEGDKAVDIAGLLCRNARFIHWMFDTGRSPTDDMEGAISGLRDLCGIVSRSELKDDDFARQIFNRVKSEFEDAIKKGSVRK